jgi:hypothetical protein
MQLHTLQQGKEAEEQNADAMHCAHRTTTNTLEQMPLFITLMWLFTVYVDAELGGRLGMLYVAFTVRIASVFVTILRVFL